MYRRATGGPARGRTLRGPDRADLAAAARVLLYRSAPAPLGGCCRGHDSVTNMSPIPATGHASQNVCGRSRSQASHSDRFVRSWSVGFAQSRSSGPPGVLGQRPGGITVLCAAGPLPASASM